MRSPAVLLRRPMVLFFGTVAAAWLALAVFTARAEAAYWYCWGVPLSEGEQCRAYSPNAPLWNWGEDWGRDHRPCVNLQWRDSNGYHDYFPWACGNGGVRQYYYEETYGYAVVKNGGGPREAHYGQIECYC